MSDIRTLPTPHNATLIQGEVNQDFVAEGTISRGRTIEGEPDVDFKAEGTFS